MSERNKNAIEALYSFFSGFGLEAFPENAVPHDAELPYITYEASTPPVWATVSLHANIYYRSSSYSAITAKADQIYTALDAGAVIPFEGGALWLYRDDNVKFLQLQSPPGDPYLKDAYLTMLMQIVSE